ncbi:MAG: antibiotic biosynthesis monooxygenase [Gammaproteobacteria bacterium]|nr:antibiotic biosynthesis monooxygenase [Gammaproteobacteria bacterium]
MARIFRVKVHKNYVTEFEKAYKEFSIPLVKSQEGFVSLSTGKLVIENNLEYVMISNWKNLGSLQRFVGDDWKKALIPDGMEKYIEDCWLHHYITD